METLNNLFYGSILAFILLQGLINYLQLQEPFATTTLIKGKENEIASLKCPKDEGIKSVILSKYGNLLYDKQEGIKIDMLKKGIDKPIDITAKSKCEKKNSCSFIVNNTLAGGDPVKGAQKFWQINYDCFNFNKATEEKIKPLKDACTNASNQDAILKTWASQANYKKVKDSCTTNAQAADKDPKKTADSINKIVNDAKTAKSNADKKALTDACNNASNQDAILKTWASQANYKKVKDSCTTNAQAADKDPKKTADSINKIVDDVKTAKSNADKKALTDACNNASNADAILKTWASQANYKKVKDSCTTNAQAADKDPKKTADSINKIVDDVKTAKSNADKKALTDACTNASIAEIALKLHDKYKYVKDTCSQQNKIAYPADIAKEINTIITQANTAKAKADAAAKANIVTAEAKVTETTVAQSSILPKIMLNKQSITTPISIQPIASPIQSFPIRPPSQLPSFMDENRLLVPLDDNELFEYKLFHVILVSCVIKDTLNSKMKNITISFRQLYRENLQKMGIESRIFERNLDAYMNAIQKQADRTWKEVFESTMFLNAITENIQYYLANPSQSKLNSQNLPIGTLQNIRKPIINESTFISAYNTCKSRMNSLEVHSPISYSMRLYD